MDGTIINRIQTVRNDPVKRKKAYRSVGGFFQKIFILIILIGISYIVISPLIGIVSKALMSITDFYNPMVYLFPEKPTLGNIKSAWEVMNCPSSMIQTLLFSLLMMLIQTFVCAFVGYGFARYKFPGCNLLFSLVILTFIVPAQTFMVPFYIQFRNFDILGLFHLFTGGTVNLMNTSLPILLLTVTGCGLRSGLFIYIFRQFFKGLPQEIEGAAFIDGAGPVYTYLVIMLPNAGPAIITVLLFSFVWQYNDVFYLSLFMESSDMLSIQLSTLTSSITAALSLTDPNEASLYVQAGILIAVIPLIIIYLVLQKHFMASIDRSGIVG